MPFFVNTLSGQGITAIIPDQVDIDFINTTIYDEMGKGIFLPSTKAKYLQIIEKMQAKGAQGVILGCTEIPILIKPEDCTIPIFDTG